MNLKTLYPHLSPPFSHGRPPISYSITTSQKWGSLVKSRVAGRPRSTTNIDRTAPRPTALSVPDDAPATVQRHCREQRTYRGTCGTYRAPVHRSCPNTVRPAAPTGRRGPTRRPAAREAPYRWPRGRPAILLNAVVCFGGRSRNDLVHGHLGRQIATVSPEHFKRALVHAGNQERGICSSARE